VNKLERRFVGVRPYPLNTNYNQLFFGREGYIRRIMRSVYPGGACVIYGVSGIGKTSLMTSGLAPKLEQSGHAWPVYISCLRCREALSVEKLIYNSLVDIREKDKGRVTVQIPAIEDGQDIPLWINKIRITDNDGCSRFPVLIFDQFESVFNELKIRGNSKEKHYQSLKEDKVAEFFDQLLFILNPLLVDELFKSKFQYGADRDESDVETLELRPSVIISITEPELGKLDYLFKRNKAFKNNLYRVNGLSRDEAKTVISSIATADLPSNFPPIIEIPDPLIDRVIYHSPGVTDVEVSPFFIQLYGSWIEETLLKRKPPLEADEKEFPEEDFKGRLRSFYLDTVESVVKEISKEFGKFSEQDRRYAAYYICRDLLVSDDGGVVVVDQKALKLNEDLTAERLPGIYSKNKKQGRECLYRIIDKLQEKRILIKSKLGDGGATVLQLAHYKLSKAIHEVHEESAGEIKTPLMLEKEAVEEKVGSFVTIKNKNREIKKIEGRLTELTTQRDEVRDELEATKQKNKEREKKLKNDKYSSMHAVTLTAKDRLERANDLMGLSNFVLASGQLKQADASLKDFPFNRRDEFSDVDKDGIFDSASNLHVDIRLSKHLLDTLLRPKINYSAATPKLSYKYYYGGVSRGELIQKNGDFKCITSKGLSSTVQRFNYLFERPTGKCEIRWPLKFEFNIKLGQGVYSIDNLSDIISDTALRFKNGNFAKKDQYFVIFNKEKNHLVWGHDGSISSTHNEPYKTRNWISITPELASVSALRIIELPSKDKEEIKVALATDTGDLVNMSLPFNVKRKIPFPNAEQVEFMIATTTKDRQLKINAWKNVRSRIYDIEIVHKPSEIIAVATSKEIQLRDISTLRNISSLELPLEKVDALHLKSSAGKPILQALSITERTHKEIDVPEALPRTYDLKCHHAQGLNQAVTAGLGKEVTSGLGKKVTAVGISPDLETLLISGYDSSVIEQRQIDKKGVVLKDYKCLTIIPESVKKRGENFYAERVVFSNESTSNKGFNYAVVGSIGQRKSLYKTGAVYVQGTDQKPRLIKPGKSLINSAYFDKKLGNWLFSSFDGNVLTEKAKASPLGNILPNYSIVNIQGYDSAGAEAYVIAVRNPLGGGCLSAWTKTSITSSVIDLCPKNARQKRKYQFIDSKINWFELSPTGDYAAIASAGGGVTVAKLDEKLHWSSSESAMGQHSRSANVWKTKIIQVAEGVDIIVSADAFGELIFWSYRTDVDELVKLFSMHIPDTKDISNLIQDMDVVCKPGERCVIAAPVTSAQGPKVFTAGFSLNIDLP